MPKWFGDIYEAVFGAIWLDQNQSLSKFWEIAGPQLKPLMKFDSHRKEERFKSLNPRKFLDEKADKFRADEPRKLTSEGMDERESKVVCAFPMVISTEFPMRKYRDDDHREDAHQSNLSYRD